MDLPCLKCGYNLRTLYDDGKCPECGVSISELAGIGWLFQCDRDWLRRTARSMIWIGIAMFCFVLLLAHDLGRLIDLTSEAKVALAVGSVAGLIGFWQFTAAPRGDRICRIRARHVARWAMAAGLVGFPLALFLYDWLPGPIELILLAGTHVCLGVGACVTLSYAAALAAKIPELRLLKQARIVGWGFALCFLLMLVVRMIVWFGVDLQMRPQQRALNLLATLNSLIKLTEACLLILRICAIPLLIWFHRHFRKALKMSQQGQIMVSA